MTSLSLADLPERLSDKIKVTPGCWLWTASKTSAGYGKFYWQRRLLQAHRVVYEMLIGPIPEGLHLDHLCRVRECVNPAHLEPVTCRENVLRGVAPSAIAAVARRCGRGHAYDDETYVDSQGNHHCGACRRLREHTPEYHAKHAERERRRRARLRAAAAAQRHADENGHVRIDVPLERR